MLIELTGGLDTTLEAIRQECDWDLGHASHRLLEQLAAGEGWIETVLPFLTRHCLFATTAGPFMSQMAVRPHGHHRSFYINSCRLEGLESAGGYLVVMGSEVQSDDLDLFLKRRVKRTPLGGAPAGRVGRSALGAVTLDEARAEAAAALGFQLAHLERWGELAQTPVPLAVHRWPDVTVARYRDALLSGLAGRETDAVDSLVAGGLGCYVYYYPNLPVRTADIATYLGAEARGASFDGRLALLRGRIDPAEVADDWLTLVGRMLILGYSPVDLSRPQADQCVSTENAVVDGGFVDVGSMKKFDAMTGERELYLSLALTVKLVANTLLQLLAPAERSVGGGRPTVDGAELSALSTVDYVRSKLAGLVAAADRDGPPADPRIGRCLSTPSSFRDLETLFRAMGPDTLTLD